MISVCHSIVEILRSKGEKVMDILQSLQQRNILFLRMLATDTEKHHGRALLWQQLAISEPEIGEQLVGFEGGELIECNYSNTYVYDMVVLSCDIVGLSHIL